MHKINEIIVVEGKCDKSAVLAAVNATVIETKGFGVFNDKDKMALLRRISRERGIIILTDNDSAGFMIRNYLKGALPGVEIKNAYIPEIEGKESRKNKPSKEGKLGVEAMDANVIIEALRRCGATIDDESRDASGEAITKSDLYDVGLTGTPLSGVRRVEFLKKQGLPEHMSAKSLLEALNAIYTREEFISLFQEQDGLSKQDS